MTMGHSDQFPSMAGDTKPVLSSMTDMAFNMTKAITEGSFMSGLQQQEMGSQEYSVNNCDNANSEDQMIWWHNKAANIKSEDNMDDKEEDFADHQHLNQLKKIIFDHANSSFDP